ncbi:hypothetical protein Ddye_031315 [Dipteronia dyeriana]|uniref:Peptidase M20 dimerisation domain-containing protein n=1 Tax=Dipteronia dyeriana TaxID=168575 RepID=A0AAD9TIM2_9ROSI|nr:hypothetical protein Ddye_031315 [Dipteronia dyeriana]
MLKEGVLGDSEAIFTVHVDDGISTATGTIATISGPLLATVSMFLVKIEGQGGHALHATVEPIVAASFTILALQQLISRETDPIQSQVLSVTHLRNGTALKIGNKTHLCSFFGFNGMEMSKCNAYIDMKEEESRLNPAVTNDESLHLLVKRVSGFMHGPENVRLANKFMAYDDFAFYQEMVPGVELSIGI